MRVLGDGIVSIVRSFETSLSSVAKDDTAACRAKWDALWTKVVDALQSVTRLDPNFCAPACPLADLFSKWARSCMMCAQDLDSVHNVLAELWPFLSSSHKDAIVTFLKLDVHQTCTRLLVESPVDTARTCFLHVAHFWRAVSSVVSVDMALATDLFPESLLMWVRKVTSKQFAAAWFDHGLEDVCLEWSSAFLPHDRIQISMLKIQQLSLRTDFVLSLKKFLHMHPALLATHDHFLAAMELAVRQEGPVVELIRFPISIETLTMGNAISRNKRRRVS
eukprot:ANDGO_04588.mRNA.1 hypothetical protein